MRSILIKVTGALAIVLLIPGLQLLAYRLMSLPLPVSEAPALVAGRSIHGTDQHVVLTNTREAVLELDGVAERMVARRVFDVVVAQGLLPAVDGRSDGWTLIAPETKKTASHHLEAMRVDELCSEAGACTRSALLLALVTVVAFDGSTAQIVVKWVASGKTPRGGEVAVDAEREGTEWRVVKVER